MQKNNCKKWLPVPVVLSLSATDFNHNSQSLYTEQPHVKPFNSSQDTDKAAAARIFLTETEFFIKDTFHKQFGLGLLHFTSQ